MFCYVTCSTKISIGSPIIHHSCLANQKESTFFFVVNVSGKLTKLKIHAMLTKQTFRLVSLASVKLKTVPSIPSISKRSLYYISTRTSPITITNQHDTRVQYPKASIQSAHRFYCDSHPKEINFKVSKSKELIKDAIQTKRTNLLMKKNVFVKDLRERKSRVQEQVQERKDVLVKDFREKKMKVQDKVQEKVRVMEEIVERENIFTIPNLLCVGRGVLAPIVGYAIIEQHFMLSMGLLAFAGLTDLVQYFSYFFVHIKFSIPFVTVNCFIY